MEVRELGPKGLIEIKPSVFSDSRGYFFESFNESRYREFGLELPFVQDNQSFSVKGVIRGLHFQKPPYEQGKLVRVIQGRVLDVVLDLRSGSATFGQVTQLVLSAEENNMLYIPPGFAHGFSALEDAIFQYKCTSLYHPASEGGINPLDPDLKIDWQVSNPIVSDKDLRLMPYAGFSTPF